jgi:DTW domain-containing protein YfiP
MPRRVEQLKGVPTVTLPPGEASTYRLRQEKRRPEGLATLEAISRAFDLLGEHQVVKPLMDTFELMVMRTLWTKGAVTTEDAARFLPKCK